MRNFYDVILHLHVNIMY